MIDTTVFIAVVGLAISVATFCLGRLTAAKNSGAADGELKADIRHIKSTQEELKEDVRQYGMNYTEVRSELEKIKGRVSKLEEIIKIYHQEGAL